MFSFHNKLLPNINHSTLFPPDISFATTEWFYSIMNLWPPFNSFLWWGGRGDRQSNPRPVCIFLKDFLMYISLSFFFLWCRSFLKCLLNLLHLFYVLVFRPQGMWDVSSLTRDQTRTSRLGRQSPNHWTARGVPHSASSFIISRNQLMFMSLCGYFLNLHTFVRSLYLKSI